MRDSPADSHKTFKLESSGLTFREGQQLLHDHKPQLLFLCETKITSKQMEHKGNKLNFQNYFAINRKGLKGGLVMFWNLR